MAAEFERLAGNPLVTPPRVLPGQLRDQINGRLIDAWAPCPVWVGPLRGGEASVPAQNRVRRDQPAAAHGGRNESAQGGEYELGQPNPVGASGSFTERP
jgi:hypothetical protein